MDWTKTVLGLAAVLLSGTVAGASGPGQPARPAPPGSSVAIAAGTPSAPAVERHSPREGYPSLGPKGAKNTLVFFTDYQ